MNYFRCGGGRSTHTATKIDVAKTPLATFESNVSGLYIPEIIAYIQATQEGSGDPSPINQRPISGVDSLYVTRTGKNLLNPNATILNAYIVGSANIVAHASNRTVILPCSPNTTYTYTWNRKVISGNDDSIVASFTSEPTIGSVGTQLARLYTTGTATFTTGASDTYLAIKYANISNTTPQDTLNDSQLELGNTATTYEQFKGDPYINFFDGLMKGTYGFVDLGTLSWTYDSTNERFYAKPTDMATNKPFICTKYPYVGGFAQAVDKSCFNIYSTQVGVKDSDYTDAITFKAAMSGVYLIYELATPTTPTITPNEINMLQSAFGTEGVSAYINLGGTYYLGTLNVGTGLLTVLGKYFVFNSAEYYGTYGYDDAPLFYVDITGEGIARMENTTYDIFLISNMLSKISTAATRAMENYEIRTDASDTPTKLYFRMDDYTSKADIDAFLANNPLQVVAELATPQTYQLTPAQIEQLLGQNNVFCSSGDVAVKFWKID